MGNIIVSVMDINLNDVAGLKVQNAAEWAVDSTVYSSQFILITSDVFFTGTDDIPRFKIADGVRTWAQLEYFPDTFAIAASYLQAANDYTDTEIVQEVTDRNAAINSALEGLKWKQSVRLASTSNLALPVGVQTIDGVLSVIGDRILLKDQSSLAQNGIYICNTGGWTRALDANTGVELQSAVVSVDEGSTNADTTWRQTTDNITIGSSSIMWVSFGATVPNASTTTRGIAKLYTSTGSNTDGSMDQNSITTELSEKFELPSLTSGSVLFSNGTTIVEDNTNLFYNTTDKILYVGANSSAFTNTRVHVSGTVDSYLQINLRNLSAGNSASADFIVTGDDGTDTTNYLDMGRNSSTYNQAAFSITGPGSGYIYNLGGTLVMGTGTNHAIIFHTNGTLAANERMRIAGDGIVYINTTTANATGFGVLRVAQGTSRIDFGEMGAGTAAIWMFSGTNTGTNFALGSSATSTILNSPTTSGSVLIRNTSSTTLVNFNRTNFMFTAAAAASGSTSTYQFTTPLDTGLTAATEKHSFEINLSTNTQQHASSTSYALQRDVIIKHLTHRFASATGVITDAFTFYVDGAPVAGTNAAITRAWGLGVVGNAQFQSKVYIGAASIAPTAYLHLAAGTASANTSPLKFTSGTNNTTAETGSMEYNGTNLFFTRTGTTRETILMASAVTTEAVVSDTTLTVNYNGTVYKLLARA